MTASFTLLVLSSKDRGASSPSILYPKEESGSHCLLILDLKPRSAGLKFGSTITVAWVLAFRQNRKLVNSLKNQTAYSDNLFRDLIRLEEERRKYAELCSIAPDAFGEYFTIEKSDKSVIVCKRFKDKYCTIKEFADPDQDFNRREAEELVEKLNEK